MEFKQALVMRADLQMGKGKLAAQASHASVMAYLDALEKRASDANHWVDSGMKKITLKVASEKELLDIFDLAKRAKLPCALVRDAGHTQLEPGTLTGVGIGPTQESTLDKITGGLKLL